MDTKKQAKTTTTEKTKRTLPPNSDLGFWEIIQTFLSVSIVLATIFTFFTPANIFSGQVIDEMLFMMAETPQTAGVPAQSLGDPNRRIGIVSGHWGYDSGAVCPDGLTEQEVNLRISTMVKQNLVNMGYQVDLMQEFDPLLSGYLAPVVVSIHNGSCEYEGDTATGFKIATALGTKNYGAADKLNICLINQYTSLTGLIQNYNKTTPDMTNFHTFNELDPATVAVVVEAGYLNLDRQILTEKPELVAKGISAGILCYMEQISPPIEEQVTDVPTGE